MARSFLRSYVSLLFFPQVQRILWKKREPSKDGSLFCLGKVPPLLQRSTGTLRRGGYYPPANPHQPLRLVATGALSTSSLPDSPRIAQPAAAARKRSQSAAPPAPALRYSSPGCVPCNGGPGESRHGGPGGWPPVRLRRPPAILWLLSHRWESNIPAKRPSNFHTISPKVKKRAIRRWLSFLSFHAQAGRNEVSHKAFLRSFFSKKER